MRQFVLEYRTEPSVESCNIDCNTDCNTEPYVDGG